MCLVSEHKGGADAENAHMMTLTGCEDQSQGNSHAEAEDGGILAQQGIAAPDLQQHDHS